MEKKINNGIIGDNNHGNIQSNGTSFIEKCKALKELFQLSIWTIVALGLILFTIALTIGIIIAAFIKGGIGWGIASILALLIFAGSN